MDTVTMMNKTENISICFIIPDSDKITMRQFINVTY